MQAARLERDVQRIVWRGRRGDGRLLECAVEGRDHAGLAVRAGLAVMCVGVGVREACE